MSVAELERAFEKLTAREQEEFAEWYEARLASIGPDADIDKLWAAEIDRRLAELRDGKVELIPGDQVMSELRERYRK